MDYTLPILYPACQQYANIHIVGSHYHSANPDYLAFSAVDCSGYVVMLK